MIGLTDFKGFIARILPTRISKTEKFASVNSLPVEIILKIFSYLNVEELTECRRLNKPSKALTSDRFIWEKALYPIIFGKQQYEKFLGDVGVEPPLPKDIYEIFENQCPFNPGKKVKETHVLFLAPETINETPVNLKTFEEFIKKPKAGRANKYRFIWSQILRKHGNTKVVKSHWVLITKDVIEVSRNKSYADQKKLIANLARETGIDYEIPSVLDAAIFMFAYSIFFSRVYNEHISSDSMFTKYSHSDDSEFTPTNDPRIYTRCREKAKNYRITVGGLSRGGLSVDCLIIDRNNIGVAPIRKFSQ